MSSQPLRIGVTGHRILTDTEAVHRGIEEALARLAGDFPGRPLTLLSSLAEGADRMAAEAVLLRPNSALVAVLPFRREDYAADFGAEGSPSRLHFEALLARAAEIVELPCSGPPEAGYEQAGRYILNRADLMLAIWDGREAQGQGGTGQMVALAREQRKPLLIVRAGNRAPGTHEPTTLGAEQGRVVTERLPG